MNKLCALAIIMISASYANAWQAQTHEHICEQAALKVWSAQEYSSCFTGVKPLEWYRFCAKEMPDVISRFHCLNYSLVGHPSLIPDRVFNDTHTHKDYSKCPLRSSADIPFLCGDTSSRPALDKALLWFGKAAQAESLCQRIYLFCIGGNYLADSHIPTNRFRGGYESECAQELEVGVEKKIITYEKEWEMSTRCRVTYLKKLAGQNRSSTLTQQFRITEEGIQKIIGELSSFGYNASSRGYKTTSTTSSTSTSSTTTSSTSTSSTTTITLNEAEPVQEGFKSVNNAFFIVLIIVVLILAFIYLKKPDMKAGEKKLRDYFSSSRKEKPTRLEGG